MAEDTGQERTEEPTPKRLADARKKGQIARSRELNTMSILLLGAITMIMLATPIMSGLANLMTRGLSIERKLIFNELHTLNIFAAQIEQALILLLPVYVVLTIVAFLAPMSLGGWSFSTQAISFKFEKLNAIKGIGKLFAWRSLVEMLKAVGKFLLVTATTSTFLYLYAEEFIKLGTGSVKDSIGYAGELLALGFVAIASALVIIALIDVPFQIWDHARQLKMTRQEVKDEYKETDGNPELKAQARRLQREMAERRMMQEVPQADVIITNPTHYAIALRYDQDNMSAPRVVAKGMELIAAEIRRVGDENDVPIVSSPPLARAIYFSTELNDEIPSGLYLAVAKVLAYVLQLRNKYKYKKSELISINNLDIPEDLQHD